MVSSAPAGDGSGASFSRQVRSGLGWSFLNNSLGRLGTLLGGILLARILQPRDYGVFAVALVGMQFVMSLNDVGITAALIRWPGDLRELARTAMTVILAVTALLYAAFFLAAPWFAGALNAPEAAGVLRLLGLTLLIDGVFAVPTALLTRSFLQGRRTVADLSNLTVSTAVSVYLAAKGHGVWSLAWGRLAGNATSGVLIYALAPARFRPGFRLAHARELLAFGMPLAGSSFLLFVMLNVDYVVVGRVLDPVALGLYVMAFNLASWPVNMFSFAVRRVSLAGFSRLQEDPPRMRVAFTRSFALLMAITVPACLLLAVLGAPLIRFVYGARWVPAAEALRFLAILGIVRVAVELGYDLLVAAGRSRAVFGLQLLWTCALIPVLALGAVLDGIRGAGLGHAAVALLLVAPAFVLALHRVGIGPVQLGRHLARPFLGGVLLVAVAALTGRILPGGDLERLAVGGAAALLAYALVVLPMRRLLSLAPAEPGIAEPSVSRVEA